MRALLFAACVLSAGCSSGPVDDADGDGWWIEDGDCDDRDPAINPAATEIPGDGIDQDCDGFDAVSSMDADGDGSPASEDCDDNDWGRAPHLPEVCDGRDNDCDLVVDDGFDEDGDGVTVCGPDGVPDNADDDCDDGDAGLFPGNAEVCDGDDDDCDGLTDELYDSDGDGATTCGVDGVAGTADDDCDDDDSGVEPGIWDDCDGVDVNCNGLVDEDCDDGGGGGALYCYADADGDGWGGSGTVVTADNDCGDPGESGVTGDCNDGDGAVHPGAIDLPNNGVDEDCDGADQVATCAGPTLYADEAEPNDSSTQTNLIVTGDGHVEIDGVAAACGGGGDQDWFSVSFGCWGPVTFELDWPGGSSDLNVAVSGAAVATEVGTSMSGPVYATSNAAAGSMLISVSCASGDPTPYTLFIDWD